jgi:pimeloyl-ACP methyl ester carboxylesterase
MKIHHATLVGHSLGGFVAQKVAERDRSAGAGWVGAGVGKAID